MKRAFVFSLFAAANISFAQSLVINELMYSPPAGGEPEWIELYNNSDESINIKDFTIRDKNKTRYTLSAGDYFVTPDSYVVITRSTAFATYHPEAASHYIVVPLPQYFLVNSSDTVSLYDNDGKLVDSMFYASSWGGSGVKSLERISPSGQSRSRANWGTSVDPTGSTPARRNSIYAWDYNLKLSSLSAVFDISKSKANFRIVVHNAGTKSTSPYNLYVFLERQSASLERIPIASSPDNPGLDPGDSALIAIETPLNNPGPSEALARIDYTSDEDTADNILSAPLMYNYSPASIVVNEIMYAPRTPDVEWVELYNNSSDSINIVGFDVSDNSGATSILTTHDYFLAPSQYVVVAHDSGFFAAHPDYSGKYTISKIPSLNNDGDVVAIHDATGTTIDSVNYLPSWGGSDGGKSLERILPAGNSNDPANFSTSTDPSGSTPGRINSITPRDSDLALGTVAVSPPSMQSGDIATVSVTVINRGIVASLPASVVLYESGMVRDSSAFGSILPHESLAVNLSTGRLFTGTHNLLVVVRYPSDEMADNNSKAFSIVVGLPPQSIVINEIMYAPESPLSEWIELYNNCDSVISMAGYKIASHGSSVRIQSEALILPHEYLVMCKDSSVAQYHCNSSRLILQNVPSLNNSGDTVSLYDNLGNLLDRMNYLPSYGGADGKSLERVDCIAGSDSANWKESVDSTGATPGIENSVAILPIDATLGRMDISPRIPGAGDPVTITLTAQNTGREEIDGLHASLDIISCIDSANAFSGSRDLASRLLPRDTVPVSFTFAPVKYGRYGIAARVSCTGDGRARNDTLSEYFSVKCASSVIIINEIMYTSGQLGEYFELYNESDEAIDADNWSYHTSNSSKPARISTRPRIVPPNGYFIVAADTSIENFIPDTSLCQVSRSLTLRDDGDCVVIVDPTGTVVDSVYYMPSWHNSDVARTGGRSLEKINPSLPSNDKTSWSTSVSQTGGTPGKRNSLYVDPGSATGGVCVSPNPFSPDGDGHDDFTFVSYSFAVPSVKVRMRIFDSVGRLIATPYNQAILPSTGKLPWDGRDGSGKIVTFGLYILFIEFTGPGGNQLAVCKKPIVVAKRMR